MHLHNEFNYLFNKNEERIFEIDDEELIDFDFYIRD